MPFSDLLLILRWLLPLWLLGWLVLPISSRLLGALPDRGLATGRFLAMVALALAHFWGASLHLWSLHLAPLLTLVFLAPAAFLWVRGYRPQPGMRRALLISDGVFVLAFLFFVWVRLTHPEIDNLEKPMDAALLAAAQRTEFLPFEHPWYSGVPFTNYYYFGPLLASLTARALATPPWQAYNLIQPALCAFFISGLWAVSAALTRSKKWGLGVALLVALAGNLEPWRQWAGMMQKGAWVPLSSWSTSRVVTDTISEYPCFTLFIGDLHGHFYAFSFATALFGVAWCAYSAAGSKQVWACAGATALLLAGLLMTNTWDVPFYSLLWVLALVARQRRLKHAAPSDAPVIQATPGARQIWLGGAAALLAAPLLAAPYFARFTPQIKGGIANTGFVFEFWLPHLPGTALYWAPWLICATIALLLACARVTTPADASNSERSIVPAQPFLLCLIGAGLAAALFPSFFYIRGHMGDGGLRHMDTVFKFWLQGWLLLGVGLGSMTVIKAHQWRPHAGRPARAVLAGTAMISVLALLPATHSVYREWALLPAKRRLGLSLNGMRFLHPGEQEAIAWLSRHAKPGESYLEATMTDGSGQLVGDFEPQLGRVAAMCGVPTYLGWPQHVKYWGAPWEEISRRGQAINQMLGWPMGPAHPTTLQQASATYIFVGQRERFALAPGDGPTLLDQFQAVWGDAEKTRLNPADSGWAPCILDTRLPRR